MFLFIQKIEISIHALREEGDRKKHTKTRMTAQFLSTPSARRATIYKLPHGTRFFISIHALREEGDCFLWSKCEQLFTFLSTPSARRATSLPCSRLR